MRRSASLALGFLSCFITATITLAGEKAPAQASPQGDVLELHSCEVYAGGCVVSSEAVQGGRSLLRAWNLTGGEFAGVPLAGLQVAALQTSSQNLAEAQTQPSQTIVYLPQNASDRQREALLNWLKSSEPSLDKTALQTRTAPLRFDKSAGGYSFSAGKTISVQTAPLSTCPTGACGESLWYTPRAATSVFTVAVDRASHVVEPLLKMEWDEAGRKNVFLGKFGPAAPGEGLYVSLQELCGRPGNIF